MITFSPTGGTAKVAEILFSVIADTWVHTDLLSPVPEIHFAEEDVCLVAVPSFGGRIPTVSAERLQQCNADGARAILVCVYGNRAYEDTLSELQDVLESRGFRCVAAVAAIAEHSIIREFGAGRPDNEDRKELMYFAEKIREHLAEPTGMPLSVPGSHGTYKSYQNTPFVPAETDECTNCGICVASCPAGAIGDTPETIDSDKCIKCMRCAAVCPAGARKLESKIYTTLHARLETVCGTRKKNELFL